MNSSVAFICLCIVAVYSTGEKTSKTKRDVAGLIPYPRVGRSDASWSSRLFGPGEVKRQGLIPFPRVGRSGETTGRKRESPENGGAMWFGPRLGRLQKRNYLNDDDWTLVRIKDLPFPSDNKEFTSRLDAASSEETDQIKDYRA